MRRRWLLALVAALLIYLLLGFLVGLQTLGSTFRQLPWIWWFLAPAVALAGHGFLFLRWQFYLRHLGYPLPWRSSVLIYGAGLSLIAAPGRSGEALRGLWLQRRHGFPLQVGVGITLAERLADLASALLVLSLGLGQKVWSAVLLGFLVLAAGGWLLTHPRLLRHLEARLETVSFTRQWVTRLLREGVLAVGRVRQLMKPTTLLVGTLLATLCWLMEAIVLQRVYSDLGSTMALPAAAVIRTATSLGGVLSLLPAGLGTSEGTAIGLSIAYGADRAVALVGTLLLRFATLVVPCLLGLAVLMKQKDLHRPLGAQPHPLGSS